MSEFAILDSPQIGMEVRRDRADAGSAAGGTLVVTAEMRRGAASFLVGDAGGRFAVQGS